MTIQIASAALITTANFTCQAIGGKTLATVTLVVNSELIPRTAFLYQQQGLLDDVSATIKAQAGKTRWNDQDTWENFSDFRGQPLPIIWTVDVIDVGDVKFFTMAIEAEFDGVASYEIYTSTTGLFLGEETETSVEEGDFDIPAFFGRFVYVTVYVSGAELRTLNITTSSETQTVSLRDVNTSTLAGTASARVIPLVRPVSRVLDIDIKAIAHTPYAVDMYVTDTPTSQMLMPMVISKADGDPYFVPDYIQDLYFIAGESPSFALFGIDNIARDGLADITMTVLPRQVMTAGNMITV